MKAKKIHIVRPEIEVEFARPILGRLQFISLIPKIYTIKRVKVNIGGIINQYEKVYEKTIYIYIITIPKIRKEGDNQWQRKEKH